MSKKVLFIALVLFGFVFSDMAGECFADALAQLEKVETYKWYPSQAEQIYREITQSHPGSNYALEAHKNLVISYILAKREGQAQQTLDNLVASFSGHSGLPEALYNIARIYERSKKYEKANSIYQQIIQQYPDSPYAGKAQLAAPRIDVLCHIESKDDDAAAVAIDSLIANFSSNSDLPASLYDIARRYERAKKYEEAKSIYQQIIQQYPGSSSAARAQLGVKRTNIFSLIESGDTKAAQEIDSLITNFSGYSDLAKSLYDAANKYERVEKYEEAKSIYQQIIQQYPDGPNASKAQLNIPKLNILSLINLGNYSTAQAAVDSLIVDFSGHSYLPAVLCDIARIYGWAGKYEEAKNIYQQITRQYPDSWYASKVQVNIPGNQILLLIDTGELNEAQAAIDKLIADFNGHPRLPWTLSRIAEQYYVKAGQLEKQGLSGQARDYLQKAIAVYETVINEFPASNATAEACYLAGNHYHKLGEYEKSTQYYQKVADDYSGYRMAWNALFLVGRYYENLQESGTLSKSEAEPKIRAAYQQLLEKYPDCKAAKHTRRWLSRHNSK